jgi:RNA polymerase sigma-70 factor (ECF subfamily)
MTNDIRKLLAATLPQMRGFALLKTRNRSEADDLLQQTALKALKAEHQFTLGTSFKAWLYQIMKNEFISSIRRKKPTANIDDVSEELFGVSGGQEDKLLKREILKAMDKMPASQRAVLIMICASGMTYVEAGEALRCSVGTVKSRLWRARRAMQAYVLDEREVPGRLSSSVADRLGTVGSAERISGTLRRDTSAKI